MWTRTRSLIASSVALTALLGGIIGCDGAPPSEESGPANEAGPVQVEAPALILGSPSLGEPISTSIFAEPVDASPCPASARYTDNDADLEFCLFEELELPAADDLRPYCEYVDDGYMGFLWTETADTVANYDCPEGFYYADNRAGQGFCLVDFIAPRRGVDVTAYCQYLDDGYIGYHWPTVYVPPAPPAGEVEVIDIVPEISEEAEVIDADPVDGEEAPAANPCPAPARYTDNGEDLDFCLFEELALPDAPDVRPYCEYVAEGTMGFLWTETAETHTHYECPEGFHYSDNGEGQGFCLVDFQAPRQDIVPSAYCHYLEDGYIGYSWPRLDDEPGHADH